MTKKIGLALGGGGAKGLAHIGVIKALEDAGIKIDFIAGTSMGALVGGWYAVTQDILLLEDLFERLKKKDIFSLPKILRKKDGALFKNESFTELLEVNLRDVKIEDCKIPFRAVATDVKDGREVILEKGDLVEVIKASAAIPVIFNPVALGGRLLMDGGLVNPVPADVARNMGADYVIAVDVSSRWVNICEEPMHFIDIHSLISLIANSMGVVEYQLARHVLETADIVLRPPVLNFSWLGFGEASEIIKSGYREMRSSLERVREGANYPRPPKTPAENFFDFLFGE